MRNGVLDAVSHQDVGRVQRPRDRRRGVGVRGLPGPDRRRGRPGGGAGGRGRAGLGARQDERRPPGAGRGGPRRLPDADRDRPVRGPARRAGRPAAAGGCRHAGGEGAADHAGARPRSGGSRSSSARARARTSSRPSTRWAAGSRPRRSARARCSAAPTRTSVGRHQSTAGWEFVQRQDLVGHAPRSPRRPSRCSSARPVPPDVGRPSILTGNQVALQVHESCGHPIELDRVLGTRGRLRRHLVPDPRQAAASFRYGARARQHPADATVPGGARHLRLRRRGRAGAAHAGRCATDASSAT